MFEEKDKNNFFKAIESLKKYRRADILDDKDCSLLEKLYTDLLPDEYILKKSIKDNTTFLIGRKGTGKSTLFLRIEQELRKNNKYIPCYLDVKTIYESAQTDYFSADYLTEYISNNELRKYLIERSFLQSILKKIIEEINIRFDNWFDKLKISLSLTNVESVKKRIEDLKLKIEDNEILKEIEIPMIKSISIREKKSKEKKVISETKENLSFGISSSKMGLKSSNETINDDENRDFNELEGDFTNIFLKIFQIRSFIEEIKSILKDIKVRHVVVLLDDFSEIDDFSIKTFVDVLLAPLNNWSDEFIKFKVAAYPNRIYYGKIDVGKIDTIDLDFYNLYSEFDRNKMEEVAIDFTRRLIEKRFKCFVKKQPSLFFDMSKNTMEDYYDLLFKVSMNVPRIIGYILSYCYQSKIIYDKQITRADIESASQRYYEEKIEPFFQKISYSLLSMDEKIDNLQLKDLLNKFIEKMTDNKRKISSNLYSGEAYFSKTPYASHFYISTALEKYLSTLELNFFISKYVEMSDKDGGSSSIFCLNYGLTQKNNLLWGKPKGTKSRKYFIERPFNFNNTIKEFLSSSKSIHCTNQECNQIFTQDQEELLRFSNYKCNKCGSSVIIEPIAEEIKKELLKIDQEKLLKPAEVEIVMELSKNDTPLLAKEIGEELDMSSQSIASQCKILDLQKGLILRNRSISPYTYLLTDMARRIYKQ